MISVKTNAVIASVCLSLAIPLHAQSNDEDNSNRGLRFSDLEFAMPRDPLLWTNTPLWEEEHTPRSQMMPALESLREAVPVGTPVDTASAIIHKAGARCKMASENELDCRYRDAETPWEYIDTIIWNVTLKLADGKVSDINVTRNWYRHS